MSYFETLIMYVRVFGSDETQKQFTERHSTKIIEKGIVVERSIGAYGLCSVKPYYSVVSEWYRSHAIVDLGYDKSQYVQLGRQISNSALNLWRKGI